MIRLINARVFKYKLIEDSSDVEIGNDVTVLVGKNESGKSAFLEALDKSLSFGNAKFDYVFDYPRKDYVRYVPQHKAKSYAKVVELTFRMGSDLVARMNEEVFAGASVIPFDFSFVRTTTYGNSNTIRLDIDHAAAVSALRKSLGSVEHVDEVFKGVKRLDEAVERIEAKNFPADNTLAVFAKDWRDRFQKSSSGWGMVDWHIWNAYVKDSLPRFLYFDDYRLLEGKINLDSLAQRQSTTTLTEADETALGLFELAGTDLGELRSEQGYENSKAKLEAIGLTITEHVFEHWKQNRDLAVEFDIKDDPTDAPPFNSGKNLYVRVKNLRHGVTVPFDQRSKGFIWFFSFMAWFSAVENRVGTDKDLILLLDEPGLSLHALAQADFLGYIDALSGSRQVIYTTHSPFMVASDRLERVRVVEDHGKGGADVTGRLEGASEESLFPLQAALGYSIAQNLFVAKKNVLVEGPADLILLLHMSALLEGSGKSGLEEGVFVPVGGLDKLGTFIALLGASKLKLAVLHDRASAPSQGLEELIREKLIHRKRVLDYGMFREPSGKETDIEDLFPENIYLEAFNGTYTGELGSLKVAPSDLGKHPRIVERLNRWLDTNGITLLKDGGFNHYRVAHAMLPKLTSKGIAGDCMASFEKLFSAVNAALAT